MVFLECVITQLGRVPLSSGLLWNVTIETGRYRAITASLPEEELMGAEQSLKMMLTCTRKIMHMIIYSGMEIDIKEPLGADNFVNVVCNTNM